MRLAAFAALSIVLATPAAADNINTTNAPRLRSVANGDTVSKPLCSVGIPSIIVAVSFIATADGTPLTGFAAQADDDGDHWTIRIKASAPLSPESSAMAIYSCQPTRA